MFTREYLLATIQADGAFACQPGQGLSVPDAATTDWMDPLSVQVGKGMAQALGFTGLAWIPLAAQMQFENGGDVKGNNPYNVTDKAGHTAGVPTYADRGQTGWWDDGANHWFAVFDTLAHGAAVSADFYLSGLNDQGDYRGYAAVVRAGRAGDPLATARAIEASLWSEDHYGGNHILPPTSELFQPDQPERDGKIVHNSVGVQVASIGGCWRFGEGSAAPWTPPAPVEGQQPISGPAVAMNFCITSIATAPGGCGTATLTAGGRTATFPVLGFWDGGVGEPGETYAGLNPEAARALDLSGQGPWQVSIELNKPAEAIWPPEVYGYATPLEAVQALAAELRGLAKVTTPAVPNLGQLAPAWRSHSACSIDLTQPAVQVPDPYTAGVSYAINPWCPYLDDVIRYTNVFLGGASGGQIATLFGVQSVSRFGYIWPIVGTRITSGFEPRNGNTNLTITFAGQTAGVHNGLDLSPGCQGQVVADKAGWLYTRQVENIAVVGGHTITYPGTAVSIVHADGLTSQYAHVGGQTLDPVLAAALATSTTTKNGYRAVYVQQGTRIASLDGIACHLHYGIQARSIALPYTYAFGGDPHARYQSGQLGETYLDIDALRVLPWDPTVLKPEVTGKLLPSWYYTVYGPTGLPPAFVPAEVGLP